MLCQFLVEKIQSSCLLRSLLLGSLCSGSEKRDFTLQAGGCSTCACGVEIRRPVWVIKGLVFGVAGRKPGERHRGSPQQSEAWAASEGAPELPCSWQNRSPCGGLSIAPKLFDRSDNFIIKKKPEISQKAFEMNDSNAA